MDYYKKHNTCKQSVKEYFAIRKVKGKNVANSLYPEVMWYLWDKKTDFKWSRIWSK